MKKFLLAVTILAIGVNANAQQMSAGGNESLPVLKNNVRKANVHPITDMTAYKGTGLTNPFTMATDSMYYNAGSNVWVDYVAPLDSGNFYGTNAFGRKGYAYLYDLQFDASGNNDTTVTIIGFYSKWGGVIQPTSTKMINFSVWGRGTDKTLISGHTGMYIYGKPSALLASQSVKDTTLRTTAGNTTITFLTTPLANISTSVYVGYTMQYTWNALASDTFGLRSTSLAGREPNYYTVSGSDSLLGVNNLVQDAAGNWKSPNYELGGGIGDMIIAPIISLSCTACHPTSINGVTRNNLTFFGNYPSPAVNSTNIRFALKNKADVAITVVDMNGRTVNTINKNSLTPGEHTVNIETAQLPSGNYVYMIQTSEGDGLASQFTVAK